MWTKFPSRPTSTFGMGRGLSQSRHSREPDAAVVRRRDDRAASVGRHHRRAEVVALSPMDLAACAVRDRNRHVAAKPSSPPNPL